ncbi:interleukin-8-like [Tachyglossus aculeatus]|uniref:interleukin-8-like n=1 Tax=Tachyglossus aculeatus TaxID=9261 RepID=UPI0018F336BB|nr:interleukin-8-like [Tachyglossus aculeatus]
MTGKFIFSLLAVMILTATVSEAASISAASVQLRCRCVSTYPKHIAVKYIKSLEVIFKGPHCSLDEVIVTLHENKEVCLDTTKAWVQELIEKYKTIIKKKNQV